MKVHFDGVRFGSHTGPNTFASRLATRLTELGHEVNDDNGASSDVSLVFIEPTGQQLANKVVQRLDGLWFKPDEFYTKNVGIERLYNRAHAVVFQSDFDKRFTEAHWPPHIRGTVIHNGLKVQPVTKFTSPELEALRNQYEQVFVCSANWHPQKRLKANTETFMHLRKTLCPNSCLIVMGANPDHVVADKDVFYTGVISEDVYMQVYSMANWMIHLAWLDHCPNTVIECISQNTPVIYSEVGGTRELVKGFGICVNEDSLYNNTLEDYDNPPHIDPTFVTFLQKMTDVYGFDTHADITIDRCADEYLKVFNSVLDG